MKTQSAFLAAFFLLCSVSLNAQEANLYEAFSRRASVPIFVALPIDSSTQKKLDAAGLKAQIEQALSERKSIHFSVVDTPEKAEYILTSDIRDNYWIDHDPVDMIIGVGAAALDAATVECYAFMQGNFEITEAKSARRVWSENLKATTTKKDMSEKDSVALINADMAKVIVSSAFSKKRNSH